MLADLFLTTPGFKTPHGFGRRGRALPQLALAEPE